MIKILKITAIVLLSFFVFNSYSRSFAVQGATPINRSIGFMKWYMRNRESIIKNYPIDQHPGDSTRMYKLEINRLNRYLSDFKHSGYVSANYLNKLRQHFVEIQSHLEKYPQWDGPIVSYETYDPFEVAELEIDGVDHLRAKVRRQSLAGNRATVEFTISGLKFISYLIKVNGKWIIDDLK